MHLYSARQMADSRELVAIQCKRYLPEFDITSGTCHDKSQWDLPFYVDGNPSQKIEYTCPCKGYKFTTRQKYKQHIDKCVRHGEWLIEYAGEQKAMNNREKEWRIKEHKLQRQLDAARKELHKDDAYRTQQKELLQIKQELRLEQAKNCQLESTILDLNAKISSLGDDDEDWQDALAPA